MIRNSKADRIAHCTDRWLDFVFAFHDRDETGPRLLARIVKRSLTEDDLCRR
jgi:hypothetical protein